MMTASPGLLRRLRRAAGYARALAPVLPTLAINAVCRPHSVNVGSGRKFLHPGWRNLDEVRSPVNPRPFRLAIDCVFPLRTATVRTVYTSHSLEHLDESVARRVLEESHRVLRDGGRLVIKIPDYDRALASWRCRDPAFFDDRAWGFDGVRHTWSRHGTPDTLDSRAAMIFCGFWNDAYGDHFAGAIAHGGDAYHGPPVVPEEFLARLVASSTPREIARALRDAVIAGEPSFHFNHQSAWSRDELDSLLASVGFRVRSFDTPAVIAACSDIPSIDDFAPYSMYCLAEKAETGVR